MQAPQHIVYHKAARELELAWASMTYRLSSEFLRVHSPSAEVRGHSPAERTLQTGKKHVAIQKVEPIGKYAIRLCFDDGHDSGIYAWPFLLKLCEQQSTLWERYLQELKAAGQSRDPETSVLRWEPNPVATNIKDAPDQP